VKLESPSSETALVVMAAEAEAQVAPIRSIHDPAAALGVPAHITLLHPFVPVARLDAATIAALSMIAALIAACG
jgi:O-methyltransferase involved in polyketide biosynthesis